MEDAGLYVVTLTNEHPISVNANDPRLAGRCIEVTRANCKFGRAKRLAARERTYCAVFGAEHVRFKCIARVDEIAMAERLVLHELAAWRVRGKTGRRNEWLEGITGEEVERIALRTLAKAGLIAQPECP